MTHRCSIACKEKVDTFFIYLLNQWLTKARSSNTHHVQDDKHSGHRIAP